MIKKISLFLCGLLICCFLTLIISDSFHNLFYKNKNIKQVQGEVVAMTDVQYLYTNYAAYANKNVTLHLEDEIYGKNEYSLFTSRIDKNDISIGDRLFFYTDGITTCEEYKIEEFRSSDLAASATLNKIFISLITIFGVLGTLLPTKKIKNLE